MVQSFHITSENGKKYEITCSKIVHGQNLSTNIIRDKYDQETSYCIFPRDYFGNSIAAVSEG